MPVLDITSLTSRTSCNYPAPYAADCAGRSALQISDAGRLSQFGANLITLAPGAWSSQRHHHSAEDELAYILSGHPSFIDDDGERLLSPGDVTTHPAGDGNGHHMINRSEAPVTFLVIGTRNPEQDHCRYPDIDLDLPSNGTRERVYQKKSD